MAINEEVQELRGLADGLAGEFWLYMKASETDDPQPTVREVIDRYFQPIMQGLTDDTLKDINRAMQAYAIIHERAIPEHFIDKSVLDYLSACGDGLITSFYDDLI